MAKEESKRSLDGVLFSEPGLSLFAVLDGASIDGLPQRLYQDRPEHYCLFPGDLEPDMAIVAPYVVHLEPASPFTTWVLENGWGRHWGLFAATAANIRWARNHFRALFNVYDPTGKPVFFRFYDPRVLRIFLPIATDRQAEAMFNQIAWYAMEDEDPATLVRFRRLEGQVRKEMVGLG